MKPRTAFAAATALVFAATASLLAARTASAKEPAAAGAAKPAAASLATVKRGEYLVKVAGCHDCHTPVKLGPNGPEPDMARALSGHPAEMVMPPAPKLAGPWIGAVGATMTAWAGPWGVSFTANLTPDKETGTGAWTERNFMDTVRTGRHLGRGRPILPPMPWQNVASFTDEDLRAVFAYLQSLPPVKNRVPEPILAAPPVAAQK